MLGKKTVYRGWTIIDPGCGVKPSAYDSVRNLTMTMSYAADLREMIDKIEERTKAERARDAIIRKYANCDDIIVDSDAEVDDDCDGGSWVTIREWVNDEID